MCKQEFDSATALGQHLNDKHGVADPAEVSNAVKRAGGVPNKLSGMITKRNGLAVLALVVIGLILLAYFSTTNKAEAGLQGVDGIQCNSLEGTTMHIHPHLNISYNGQGLEIPSRIGMEASCLYGLHTHDSSGTIHIESPTIANYTLGEFIDVWAKTQPYGPGYTVSSLFNSSSISASVNNVSYDGDYRSIVLKDGEQIYLSIRS